MVSTYRTASTPPQSSHNPSPRTTTTAAVQDEPSPPLAPNEQPNKSIQIFAFCNWFNALVALSVIGPLIFSAWAIKSYSRTTVRAIEANSALLTLNNQLNLVLLCQSLGPAMTCEGTECKKLADQNVNDCGKVLAVTKVSSLVAAVADISTTSRPSTASIAAAGSTPTMTGIPVTSAVTKTVTSTVTVAAPARAATGKTCAMGCLSRMECIVSALVGIPVGIIVGLVLRKALGYCIVNGPLKMFGGGERQRA